MWRTERNMGFARNHHCNIKKKDDGYSMKKKEIMLRREGLLR
jgi:hypothetical protein